MRAVSILLATMLLSHFNAAQGQINTMEDEEICLPIRRASTAKPPRQVRECNSSRVEQLSNTIASLKCMLV